MANGAGSIGNSIGNAVTSVPIGDMVRAMALAVADAQFELDKSSMLAAEFMSGRRPLRDGQGQYLLDDQGRPLVEESLVQFGYVVDSDGKRVPNMVSMLELGFVPTFYQFVDTVIEIKLALRGEPGAAGGRSQHRRREDAGPGCRHWADRQQCTGGRPLRRGIQLQPGAGKRVPHQAGVRAAARGAGGAAAGAGAGRRPRGARAGLVRSECDERTL